METKATDDAGRSSASSAKPSARAQSSTRPDEHLATFPHEGRFWDVSLAVVEGPADSVQCRARLRFMPVDHADDDEPLHTAVLIIEPSYEQALKVARRYQRYELSALLRSIS